MVDGANSEQPNKNIPVAYQPIPSALAFENAGNHPIWRIRIESLKGDVIRGFDINGDIVLGRDKPLSNLVDLTPFGARDHGVSRGHLMLRPTVSHLYAIDLGSTNGTYLNGRSIGLKTPYSLSDGDTLTLSSLQLMIHIDARPDSHTRPLQPQMDLADALTHIAQAITSQLTLQEVLKEVVNTAQILANAEEAALWLLDEKSGDLYLAADQGIEEERIKQMRMPVSSLLGQVLENQQPMRAMQQSSDQQIKVKTGYLVSSIMYVPIILGGVALGVLAAGHRQKARNFTERDERILAAIGDFAAIAIHNARLYEATDHALARRVQELAALNEVSAVVTATLDLNQVYRVLVQELKKYWPKQSLFLHLYHKDKEVLSPILGEVGEEKGTWVNQGVIWMAAHENKRVMTNTLPEHPRYHPTYDYLTAAEPQALIVIPLVIQDAVVGVLSLMNDGEEEFDSQDVENLASFANPIATAIHNAQLFAELNRQQVAIQATAKTLGQPLIIIDNSGKVLVSNEPAEEIIANHLPQLFAGISRSIGQTTEIVVGEKTYLCSGQHLPDVGTIIVMQDITYVKQLEADRAELMRALSHDLKSPLTSIIGFATLIRKTTQLDERSQRYIEKIESGVYRMGDMITELLQVSRSDDVQLTLSACDLDQIVKGIIDDVEGTSLSKQIPIHYHMSGPGYMLMVDESRVYHLILNIVDNALKYAPEKTNIYVHLKYHGDEMITLRVRDEGPGIPPEDLNRIFDKYYRVDSTSFQPGSGVGLSVVAAIAQAHGGQVSARNHPKGGAEFTVALPGRLKVQPALKPDAKI